MNKSYNSLIPSFYESFHKDCLALLTTELQDFELYTLENDFSDVESRLDEDPILMVKNFSILGKMFETCLITGTPLMDVSECPRLFRSESLLARLPSFLNPIFRVVLDEDGRPYGFGEKQDAGNPTRVLCVLLLRQYLLAFSKVEDISPDIDELLEVRSFSDRICQESTVNAHVLGNVLSYARTLLREVLNDGDSHELDSEWRQWVENPFGRHGPGAVAEGEKGAEKWQFSRISGIPENLFEASSDSESFLVDSDLDEKPKTSRLAIVPKDFRGHRLICIEPKELMFAQQALMEILMNKIHRSAYSRSSIDFKNQVKSQILSRDPRFSTLDLKDASDHLRSALLRLLLPRPVYSLLARYRSTTIQVPNSSEPLADITTAFTMGNALCFPIETIVFWALTVATMLDDDYGNNIAGAIQMLRTPSHLARRYRCRVFGDDIIVPRRSFESVKATLTAAGFVINTSKSCNDTVVREACGSWWYGQYDVRITRFRYQVQNSPLVWLAWCENAHQLYETGFHHSATSLLRLASEMRTPPLHRFGGELHLPLVQLLKVKGYRWNSELQRVEFETFSVKTGRTERLAYHKWLYAWWTQNATRTADARDPQQVDSIWTGLD